MPLDRIPYVNQRYNEQNRKFNSSIFFHTRRWHLTSRGHQFVAFFAKLIWSTHGAKKGNIGTVPS